jgi:hypothetical protein
MSVPGIIFSRLAFPMSMRFEGIIDAICKCSLGQITHALFEVGGQYRRSM